MSWNMVSSVEGGHIAVADLRRFHAAASALRMAAASARREGLSWTATLMRIEARRPIMALCPASPWAPEDPRHRSLPFDLVGDRCREHARACRTLAETMESLASLVIRAGSLYSHTETTTRRIVNELLGTGMRMLPIPLLPLAAGATAATAMGGAMLGSGDPIEALTSTAFLHEGLMTGIGGIVAGLGVLPAAVMRDEVNRAADLLASATARITDLIQGNELKLTEVSADAPVAGESRDIADVLANLSRLGTERIDGGLGSGLSYGTIGIQEYRDATGRRSWLVLIPGTDGRPDSPFGWAQNVELMSSDPSRRMRADSARMVAEAMRRAGIGRDEPVALAGHSQGGIVAAAIASDMTGSFAVRHVLTAGSPIANHPIPQDVRVTSIEIDDEVVAALDGAPNPTRPHWVTIRGTRVRSSTGVGTPVDGAPDGKEISHWLRYHQAALADALDIGSPAVRTQDADVSSLLAGGLVSTTYWRGRMEPAPTRNQTRNR
ncbi:alpha/beta hydrolase [uncultured Bifidobacterium sp.]|uniref:PGAP1-like alpha/beta domain-containing protein n=1 Tax=uncultured Bifidobacterium sp. TaxID=165187 RepID=UPI0028DCF465|nr:alpha/beta hydrolase [uncultured Bifidobacterium sp.]